MKTIPKGIENLTEDERRITRIDEARSIPGFPNYYITPAGWVWSCKKNKERGGFIKPNGSRQNRHFGYRFTVNRKEYYFTVRDLVEGIFGIVW